jgi:outer membrane lipoprotein-sorting protein
MKKSLLILFIFCLSGLLVHSSPVDSVFRVMKDTTAFKNKLAAFSKSLISIESDFTQHKSMSMLKTPVVSEGYFCYRNGTQVRWEYQQPFEYLVVINDGKLTVKDESHTNNYDMTSNKAFLEINANLTSIIDGSVLEKKTDFSPKYYENDNYYKIELTTVSKDMKEYFSNVVVYFDKTDCSVSKLFMNESSGDNTVIEFHHKKINQPISDEKFIIR